MVEPDTIKLLHECDAGVKMGITSIDEVSDYVSNDKLRKILTESEKDNQKIEEEIRTLLSEYQEEGKDPNLMAKGMSWVKTNMKLSINDSDQTVADLITEGCNMGIKSLNRYLNQYQAAEDKAKDLTKRLIAAEEKLAGDIREFL